MSNWNTDTYLLKEDTMPYEVKLIGEKYCILDPQKKEVKFKFYEEKYAIFYCRYLNGELKGVKGVTL